LRGAEGDEAIQKAKGALIAGFWIASLRSQ
jgi:hypothetical protein